MPLGCEGNSITGTISCNPGVILTEFNPTSCETKWTGTISSTCGTVFLTGNDGLCTNNVPPFWSVGGSFDGCPNPETCCPQCYCVGVDIYPNDEADQFGCNAINDAENVVCGFNSDEVWNQAGILSTQLSAQYPNCSATINGAPSYLCNGNVCQSTPCQQ